ncbi:hypothetical protein [Pseudomonas sp. GM_Psu_2]|uniref:hypothetical protein n=1 Tax=unclassified Pseudomonas TaxID=196821 RepID=UPI002269EC09|nr:hypothetical protein [Pseudomonas sp. GM_Psu_2]
MAADKHVRGELVRGLIAGENDYTSQFTGIFRRDIESRNIPGLSAQIQVLKPRPERHFGADACIILKSDTHFKIGIFEAKWPSLSLGKKYWDSFKKFISSSRFSSQLQRQNRYWPDFAIWEMFYSEYPYFAQPSCMPDEVSACVWHDDAYRFMRANVRSSITWNNSHLISLLEAVGPLTIGDVMQSMCACTHGRKFVISEYNALTDELAVASHALVITYSGNGEALEFD